MGATVAKAWLPLVLSLGFRKAKRTLSLDLSDLPMNRGHNNSEKKRGANLMHMSQIHMEASTLV